MEQERLRVAAISFVRAALRPDAGDSPWPPKGACLPRKEVIQPLVPQRLPCYDFIPITTHTLGRRSAGLRVQTAFMM